MQNPSSKLRWHKPLCLVVVLLCTGLPNTASAISTQPRLMVQAAPTSYQGMQLAMSADNRLVASAAGRGGAIYIWEQQTGRLVCRLDAGLQGASPGPGMSMLGMGMPPLAFSRDGLRLASGSSGGRVLIWDLPSCRKARELTLGDGGGKAPSSMMVLPDGSLAALSGGDGVYIGKPFEQQGVMAVLPTPSIKPVALQGVSADGRVLLFSGRSGARTGESSSAIALPTVSSALLQVANGAVTNLADFKGALGTASGPSLAMLSPGAAALSLSGRWVATLTAGELRLFDSTSKALLKSIILPGAEQPALPAAAPSPVDTPKTQRDAKRLGSDLINAGLEKALRNLPPEIRQKKEAEIRMLFKGMETQVHGKVDTEVPLAIKSVEPATRELLASTPARVLSIAPSWIGFAADDQSVLLWRNFGGNAGGQSGNLSAISPAVIEVRRVPDLALVREIKLEEAGSGAAPKLPLMASSLAMSPDRSRLALGVDLVAAVGGKMGVIDLSQANPLVATWRASGSSISHLAWREDGRLLAVQAGQVSSDEASLLGRTDGGAVAQARALSLDTSVAPQLALGRSSMEGISWDLATGDVRRQATDASSVRSAVAVSPGGRFLAMMQMVAPSISQPAPQLTVKVLDGDSLALVHAVVLRDQAGLPARYWAAFHAMAVSPDGKFLAIEAFVDGVEKVAVVDAQSGQTLSEHRLAFRRRDVGSTPLMFSDNGAALYVFGKGDEGLIVHLEGNQRFSTSEMKFSPQIQRNAGIATLPEFGEPKMFAAANAAAREAGVSLRLFQAHPASGQLAAARSDGMIAVVKPGQGSPVLLEAHAESVTAMAFSPDGRRLVSSSSDGTTLIWDVGSGIWIAKLFTFADGTWAVVAPSGRFDTNNVEALAFLHWVMPDDPLHALPLDIFMRDYFSPGLLPRLLSGSAMPPLPELGGLNRTQPSVRLVSVVPSKAQPGRVDVSVEVASVKGSQGRASGAKDLRLFRNGQLVGLVTDPLGTEIAPAATGKQMVKFSGIRLPSRGEAVQFSAYAFNSDRVKSQTAQLSYDLSKFAARAVKGRAYVVAIGVNASENPAFDLSFAANDADEMAKALGTRLTRQGDFREVIAVPLVSDARRGDATKSKIRSVLEALAGRQPQNGVLSGVPNAEKLEAATPDDVVIVSFAGHGFAQGDGQFYLLPQDIGKGAERGITPAILQRSVSSDELAAWLKDVDAGEMAMIVDACQSAASIEGDGFKPGPMGSKGLGQLAYDKGMRLLAASQADNVAIENRNLRHGLLTFALVRDGLDEGLADYRPKDRRINVSEWMAFGVLGVPKLQKDLGNGLRGSLDSARAAKRVGPDGKPIQTVQHARLQQPRLFDFSRAEDSALIDVLAGEPQ